jgi:stage II sporulation protein D
MKSRLIVRASAGIAIANALLVAGLACSATLPRRHESQGTIARDEGQPVVRVALQTAAPSAPLSATGGWRLYAQDGLSMLARSDGNDIWTIRRAGGGLQATRGDGQQTAVRPGPFIARPDERGSVVTLNGKRYRGELAVIPTDTGLLVVNRVLMEDYLRGVVPLEIGNRTMEELAAAQAQAVAARSYAYIRVNALQRSVFDVRATVMDQVYGGADAESEVGDNAVASTSGLVLRFGGRVVNAPYHSTCGGSTAEAPEVWRSAGEAYLQRVSDRIPGSDRFYCDVSPRFSWSKTLRADTLAQALQKHLGTYVSVPGGRIGTVQRVEIDGHTPSGRVATLAIATDRGRYVLRGNDIRFVMRRPGGEILNSTYFSIDTEQGRAGGLSRITIRGRGYGHGIGMCQWGAIGRARAGEDFRSILRTYYPGTSVGPA